MRPKTKRFTLLLLLPIGLCMLLTVCGWPWLVYRELPKLASLDEVELVENQFNSNISWPDCLAFVGQKQKLLTAEQDNFIWGNLPAHWRDGSGYLLGFHHEAYYERRFTRWTIVRSSVFFNNDQPLNDVSVSNVLVLDLPDSLCSSLIGD